MRYAWIEKHRQTYSTTMTCELLSVSRSGLNAARGRERSKRSLEDEQLVKQIRQSQHKHRGRYGRRRMTTEISEAQGRPVKRGKRSSSTSATTIPSGATPRWATLHRLNSSGAGAPSSAQKTEASRL